MGYTGGRTTRSMVVPFGLKVEILVHRTGGGWEYSSVTKGTHEDKPWDKMLCINIADVSFDFDDYIVYVTRDPNTCV